MKISEQWLRAWVNPDVDTQALAHQLTMAGLEVDAVEPVAGAFSGVVVGEIVSAEPHPDADKLRVCQVSAGGDTLQVVCGAPNARVGLKAPFAQVGALLPGDFRIRKATLRGQASEGMLCAESELGLSDADAGLMELAADAPSGADLRDYLGLDDQVIEVDLTPNRADCLSMLGIAREVALLNGLAMQTPEMASVPATIERTFEVTLDAPERCPRYVGRVIKGVDLSRSSPLWLQERLRRAGLRSIDPAVDVTNYVLLELGQPMHAFDLDTLQGGIVVRCARAGESLELLDGQTLEPREDSLVIADHEGPLALAGIMGGEASAVSATSRNLFLESAFFAPQPMAGQARGYGLHTDSSHRFERGVDFSGQRRAMERATALLLEIAGGSAGPVIDVVDEASLPARPAVMLRAARIPRVLGLDLPAADVERILGGLGLGVTTRDEGWQCEVPSWRFDIAIEADLLEELARVYGYERLPTRRIRADLVMPSRDETRLSLRPVKSHLASRGYDEAITYSFVDPELQALFDPQTPPVALANPISADMAVMRTSLLPGLVGAARRNLNRQQGRLRLYETGLRFVPGEKGLLQEPVLCVLLGGPREPEGWNASREAADFYDLKGDIESLFRLARREGELRFTATERAALHPGRTAAIHLDGEEVGYLGALHPTVRATLDLDMDIFVAEIRAPALLSARMPAFQPVSRFPVIRRDIAVVVDKRITAGELAENVRAVAGPYFEDFTLFDVYEGKGIDPKRKSVAMGLTFRDQSRTLSDEEVTAVVQQVIDSLQKNYNAEQRS
ncbi:MAG: phenylalanine--tRNA ligase subunit beta [Chromatocurvus sp.]